jgi:uncharacterized protein YihD (DUF1040 family)
MRSPDRIDPLLVLLARAWKSDPDLLLGQLISNAAALGGWANRLDTYSVEDSVIAKGLGRMLGESTSTSDSEAGA